MAVFRQPFYLVNKLMPL